VRDALAVALGAAVDVVVTVRGRETVNMVAEGTVAVDEGVRVPSSTIAEADSDALAVSVVVAELAATKVAEGAVRLRDTVNDEVTVIRWLGVVVAAARDTVRVEDHDVIGFWLTDAVADCAGVLLSVARTVAVAVTVTDGCARVVAEAEKLALATAVEVARRVDEGSDAVLEAVAADIVSVPDVPRVALGGVAVGVPVAPDTKRVALSANGDADMVAVFVIVVDQVDVLLPNPPAASTLGAQHAVRRKLTVRNGMKRKRARSPTAKRVVSVPMLLVTEKLEKIE
jgi:hypothetical protein